MPHVRAGDPDPALATPPHGRGAEITPTRCSASWRGAGTWSRWCWSPRRTAASRKSRSWVWRR